MTVLVFSSFEESRANACNLYSEDNTKIRKDRPADNIYPDSTKSSQNGVDFFHNVTKIQIDHIQEL